MNTGPTLHHIADRVLNRPLLIHPDKANVILNVLSGRLPGVSGTIEVDRPEPEGNRFTGSSYDRDSDQWRLFRAEDGVAVISIVGSLVNRGAWIGASSGLTSYEGLTAQLTAAAEDPGIRSIVLDIDSPGGEAGGMFALADLVRQINAEKPVTAVLNDMAASAAYGIASSAGRIVGSRTSMAGSIGVVVVHGDFSGKLKKDGIRVSLIHAGAHKVDGNPFEPLSAEVRADIQEEIDALYSTFVDTVAAGRGDRLSADAARATEARVLIGAAALDAGLIDEIGSFQQVMAELTANPRATRPFNDRSSPTMAQTPSTNGPDASTSTPPAFTQADMDRARADGVAQERARISAILSHDEADGRAGTAMSLAFETDLSPEQAATVLSSSAKETTAEASVPTIEERSAGQAEAGSGDAPKAEGRKPFASAIKSINARNARTRKAS